MDYDFKSQADLFRRVKPALRAKRIEFSRLGFSNVKDTDIWNYLIVEKWKNGSGLMLSDIVSDIMHADIDKINKYLENNNLNGSQNFDENIDVI